MRRLLYVRDGELGRLLPFFLLYLLASAAFTLADGLTLTLFVKRAGADDLPLAYGFIAVANLLLIGLYVLVADRAGSGRVFAWILGAMAALYLLAWAAIRFGGGADGWLGMLFVSREIGFTLVLMHFGTFVQDYFTRDEMNRVLPLIYAGGRAGGIAGGALLQHLSPLLGLVDLVLVFVALVVAVLAILAVILARCAPASAPEDDSSDDGVTLPGGADEASARRSLGGFLRFAWASPLLFWTGVTTLLFVVCRWVLNYQYSAYLADHFADPVALAEFLGGYTQVALLVSLLVQVFLVNRLVARFGLKGTHFIYTALLASGLGLCLLPMTLAAAVFARLVEAELRFGLRNPVAQLLTNKFSKPLRIRVRAWSFGVVIPLGTLAASAALAGLTRAGGAGVAWFGGAAAAAYLLSSFGLYGSFRERLGREPPEPVAA